MDIIPKQNKNDKEKLLRLSAINPIYETNIIDNTETEVRGKDWVAWGKENNFGEYLVSLFNDCPTLQSIINGATDYSCGDDIIINIEPYNTKINDKGETVNQVVRNAFLDYWIYGAFALNVVRNKLGGIAGVYYTNVRNIRSDKKNTYFWYSEDWSKSYGRVKSVKLPAFDPNKKDASSILYVKRTYNGVYGLPVYSASLKAAEMEKSIDTYHLNAINNNFTGSYILSFNDGVPTPEAQEEITNQIEERFTGFQNAARMLVAFNRTKENAITVEKLDTEDYGTHYQTLADRCQQALFTSFRMNANLAGIPTAQGFNSEEFASSFKLFNKTMILPSQRLMCDTFKKIFGQECLEIKPFSINFTEEGSNDEQKVIE